MGGADVHRAPKLRRRHHRMERHQHDVPEQVRRLHRGFQCPCRKCFDRKRYQGEVRFGKTLGLSALPLLTRRPFLETILIPKPRTHRCAPSLHAPIWTPRSARLASSIGIPRATTILPCRPSTEIMDLATMLRAELWQSSMSS